MSITPLPNANFTPTMGTYNTPQTFRFWCQKVLPLVYDDSLSYYELLCKVVDYLNSTMEDVNTAVEDITNLHTAYEQLQSYVNTYFDSLDVQEEINNKLDGMVEDGTFDTLLAPYMAHYQDELDLMKTRLTNLETAYPSGGTSADAELADIRVAYNGETYPTAGDSVRTQVQDLHTYFNYISDTTRNLWQYGNQTFIGSKTITLNQPLEIGTYAFSAVVISTDVDADVCRIVFKDESNANISIADIQRNTRAGIALTLTRPCYSIELRSSTNAPAMTGDTSTWEDIQLESGATRTSYVPPFTADDEVARALITNMGTAYISPNGSDSNDGTSASPFKTIQHAIDAGYRNICVKQGTYFQSVTATKIDNINIYADNSDEYTGNKRTKPIFTNGKQFTSFNTDQNGYKYFTLSGIPHSYTDVFITHSKPPLTTGNRPSYNAGLWANHSNKFNDFKIKPVLTYSELTEENTFYFDGSEIYFNVTTDITSVTVVYDSDSCFSFTECNNLALNGIGVQYANSTNLIIHKSNNVLVQNCEFGYTLFIDNVSASFSNVKYINCESYKANNDGFNSHYYGVSIFENCNSLYNGDDGESSHEFCEVIVHGGEYSHNGKGGHAPVNRCSFKCDGTYTHDNLYGFYMVGSDASELPELLINNSISVDNTYDLTSVRYLVKIWNTKANTMSGNIINLSN